MNEPKELSAVILRDDRTFIEPPELPGTNEDWAEAFQLFEEELREELREPPQFIRHPR